jgi:hypothetical protein
MPVEGSCGAEDLANEALIALLGDKDFSVPAVDLSGADFQIPTDPPGVGDPSGLANTDLTEGKVDGKGTFDALMAGIAAHLREEYDKNRITGEQYTKAYIALTESALGNSVQFLLGRDIAYWNAINAQLQARLAQAALIEARVKVEIAKAQLQVVRMEAANQEANYGLTKMKLATESIQYCIGKFNLEDIMPEQKALVSEQVEAARGQTLDTRRDGTVIIGMMGKQKDLLSQQITSYKRDAETKVMKIFSDAWITMKSLDEGLLPPDSFTNANLDVMLNQLQQNVELTTPAP